MAGFVQAVDEINRIIMKIRKETREEYDIDGLKEPIPENKHESGEKIVKTIYVNTKRGRFSKLLCYDIDTEKDNKLKKYSIIANKIFGYTDLPKKIKALSNLMKKIRIESDGSIREDTIIRAGYNNFNEEFNDLTKSEGPIDYQQYQTIFDNPGERMKIQAIAEQYSKDEKKHISFTDIQLMSFYTALNTELERAVLELECQTGCNIEKNDIEEQPHFHKEVKDEELEVIFNGLMEHNMLCDNPSFEDFVYWHTGRGERPKLPLTWVAKNVCRYYVFIYLNKDWTTAEQCFICQSGPIKNLRYATNISDKNKAIIDQILAKARKTRRNEE